MNLSKRDYLNGTARKREALRAEIQLRRDELSPVHRTALSTQIVSHLSSWMYAKDFNSVMLYLNMKSEVETMSLLECLLQAEKQVSAPVVDAQNQQLIPRRIRHPETELVRHNYIMLEPKATCPTVPLSELELILVPGLVFDRRGHRLGYGTGFYDRFLPKCPRAVAVGVAYELQLVADIFPQPWDIPLHHIFTENGVVTPL